MSEMNFAVFLVSIFLLTFGIFVIILASRRFRKQFWIHFVHNHAFTLLQLFSQPSALGGLCTFSIGLSILIIVQWYPPIVIAYITLFSVAFFVLFGIISNKWPLKYYIIPFEAPKLQIRSQNAICDREFQMFEKAFHAIYRTLSGNLIPPIYHTKSWFAIPGSKYPAAYLWDSCFISGAWRLWDSRIAQEILRPFLDHQRDDGMCPQTVVFGAFSNYSITNPPLLAVALVQSAEMDNNRQLCMDYYSKLQRYELFIEKNRLDNGLFKWLHSYESGIDNSPRFTNQSESEHYDLSHLWAIDFNVYMVLHYQAMRKIADWTNRTEDIQLYDQKIATLVDYLIKYLWDSNAGLFFDYDYQKSALIKIKTIFSTFPLIYDSLPTQQKRSIIQHLLDTNEFNTPIPFPTVARNEESFQKDTWRGPVWINTAWIPLQGVLNIDQISQLSSDQIDKFTDMAYRLVKGVYQTYSRYGSFYEFYDPDGPSLSALNRKKGNLFKKITLGDKPIYHFCGWTALVNTILIEFIIGYHRKNGEIILCPHIPKTWYGSQIQISIPQYNEKLFLESNFDGSITVKMEINQKNSSLNVVFNGSNHHILEKKP